ncbi:methyl-accepting chemotaxis protein [Alsobacter sp. SYSU BS001988]|jgi:methyl-accepting chemotaxis protein
MISLGSLFGGADEGYAAALNRSQAVIELSLSGEIITANATFLKTMGYALDEIRGKHHSILVDPAERDAAAYREFWERLRRGQFDSGQYRRIAKDGRGVWLQASYNPVLDKSGAPVRVVKFAADITAEKTAMAEMTGRLNALDRVQATIEFGLDGVVLTANPNFLKAVGYTLDEIKGRHHSMFVDPAEAQTAEYRRFWDKLRKGDIEAGQFRRIGKGGREVWIDASYNPIFDADGKPCKVMKFATDVTAQIRASMAIEKAASAVVEAAKDNDLSARIVLNDASGAMRNLAEGVNQLLETFSGIIDSVRQESRSALSASSEIATGNEDLANRTEQQAASLEETAATTEQLAASVKSSAQSSRQAAELAAEATGVAQAGGEVVRSAVSAMGRIEDSSRKITDITSVIDEIAFQTNLLALNAAVEAARAGEAGKGFAVVASEVRTLAQRSSTAAKDITALISEAASEVAAGVALVRRAGEALDQIVVASNKVSATVSEISAASGEQSSGIEEMSQAIAHMDEITQQNASLAEQGAGAAASLAQHVQHLAEFVEAFKTDRREEPARAASVARLRARA